MERLKALWSDVRDNLWFVPTVCTIGGAILALLLVGYDDAILDFIGMQPDDYWWLFGGGSSAARSILEAIGGSIITVTGVVFSVTIIALQLTSSQFTPRVLRKFTADRGNQLVLGVFIATFTYTLLVQRAVRESNDGQDAFVPAVAITGAVLLALLSIGFLIYFIAHTTRSIQANVIIDNVARETRGVAERVFGLHADRQRGGTDAIEFAEPTTDPRLLGRDVAGYVQAVDEDRLLEAAQEHDLVVRVEAGVGDFVLPDQPLLAAWPASDVTDAAAKKLANAFVVGPERTPRQDVELGLIELVDIAVKALSPSVNDPTTAITSLDRLTELVVIVGGYGEIECRRVNAAGRVSLIVRRPTFDEVMSLTFDQIRHHAAGIPQVIERLIDRLGALGVHVREEHRSRVLHSIEVALRAAEREIDEPDDLNRVAKAAAEARRGIG